ncbi:MAG: GNAT family N-acetyltransferase [Myxococcota bacterium]
MAGRIRRVEGGDLGQLVALVGACFEPAWSEAALRSALAAPGARAWIAERAASGPGGGAGSVGFVLARKIVDGIEIDLVGVVPAARRGGVAGALLRTALAGAAREGCVEARLELSARNEAAAKLYAALGFVVVGRRPRYYPDGSDALLLSRALA